jgi:hypothetical protein
MCDQVVALLSPEQSASLVWNEQESDAESVYTDVDDYDRLFAFEVSKTNEQEESATARPGFQVLFTVVSCYRYPLLLTKKTMADGFPFYFASQDTSRLSGGSCCPFSTTFTWGNIPGYFDN